jgi:sugar lactone lactonase YvrE
MTEPIRWIAQPLNDLTFTLAEGPHWNPKEGLLSWVDIPAGNLWACLPRGLETPSLLHHVDDDLGVAIPHQEGWICAVGPALQLVIGGDVHTSVTLETPGARLNDGKVDPRGRFWVGSKGHANEPGRGHLYMLDLDGTASEVLDGLTISNGLGWSPDHTTMYVTDSVPGDIYAFDFDVNTGAISNRRIFIHLESDLGSPDGLCVDSEGAVWTALWGGRAVHRYSAAGELIGVIDVDASHVTSCSFVGADLTTLAITTANDELAPEVLATEPHAGSIFLVNVGVTGILATPCSVNSRDWTKIV